jgi:hypothetical protein
MGAALDEMLYGAMAVVADPELPQEMVLDLIPVRPVADEVAQLTKAYREKLPELMAKIRP